MKRKTFPALGWVPQKRGGDAGGPGTGGFRNSSCAGGRLSLATQQGWMVAGAESIYSFLLA